MVRALLTSLGACCLLCGATPTAAAVQTASSAEVKAAFLFNFSKFVEWPRPAATSGRFVIGVMGDRFVANALADILRGKSFGGKPLVAKTVSPEDDLTTLLILFIGNTNARHLHGVLKRLGTASVLTVSDLDRFCEAGGMIQFRTEDDRVRFDVNLAQSDLSGLAVNSKLLALAKTVHLKKTP